MAEPQGSEHYYERRRAYLDSGRRFLPMTREPSKKELDLYTSIDREIERLRGDK